MALQEQRRGSGDVRRGHARPGERGPAVRHRGRTSTPGAATSGFRRWDIVVGPTDENSAWVPLAGAPVISTAPTVIALREFAGDEMEPAPRSLKSFPAATTETTPASAAASSASATTSLWGSISRLADREVEDVHPVLDCGFDRGDDLGSIPVRAQARVRPDQGPVVADVRARRDARHRLAVRRCACIARGDPATCVPCPELSPSKARPFRFLARGGGNARATMTFALVKRTWPFGKPASSSRWDRKRDVPGRRRCRSRRSSSLAGGLEILTPEGGSADLLRARSSCGV